jgi:hypothetical protein
MKSLTILLFAFAFAGSIAGQSFSEVVAKVRQIKLLESTRDDVKRILSEYEASDDDDHYQVLSKGDLRIEVTYASGICEEDSGENDASEIWSVKEWTVTRIEISSDEPIALRDAGLNFTTLKKEPRFPNDPNSLVLHDKAAGLAIKTTEDGIENLIFYPSRMNANRLCRSSIAAKGFYIRKGWFPQDRPYDYACVLVNQHANVEEMNLSANDIDASPSAVISISTVARDPENDVLTYVYKISAGKIIGTGANVRWDLSDVAPGNYTITVGVDDGVGIVGKTVTKTVFVN